MTNNLEDEVKRIVAHMDTENEDNTQPQQDAIQDVYVLIVREQEEDQTQIVDSTPAIPHNVSFLPAYAMCSLYILLILSTLVFQCYCMMNPLVATITILPKSQTVTLSGTMQLGRLLPPLTISQSQTTPATGKGHQNAQAATGYITFYNGQFQSITIAAGTIFTSASGVQILTDQDALMPAGNPATGYGHTTVSAHAMNPGSKANIAAYDINQTCCATSVLAKNTQPFYGGQDERIYATVAQKDRHSVSTVLKTTLDHSIAGAIQGQLTPQEQLYVLPCTPTVTSDHQPGQEATSVNVTVSQTCSAVAYNSQELATKATAFLTSQARQKAGAGYSLFGTVQVRVTQATITSSSKVFLSFSASGTWIYGLSHTAQQQIKHMIAGKAKQDAETLLSTLPGVEQASIWFTGFGDDTRLPKSTEYIHVTIFVV